MFPHGVMSEVWDMRCEVWGVRCETFAAHIVRSFKENLRRYPVADTGFEDTGGPTFLGIRITPPLVHFLWSHYTSLYLDFLFPEATIKVYTWIFFLSHYKILYLHFWGISNCTPLCIFSEATIKVYTLDF